MAGQGRQLHRNRDFRLLWVGQAFSTTGSEAAQLAFPLLALSVTHSAAQAGLTGFVTTLPMLVVYLPAGVLVDRHSRRVIMFTSSLLGAVAMGGLGVLAAVGELTLAPILVAAFVQGAAIILFQIAELGLLPHIVRDDDLNSALGLNEGRAYAARLVGPPLGGILFGIGRAVPFVVDAVSYAVAGLCAALVKTRMPPIESEMRVDVLHEIAEGVRFLWRQPFIRASALLIAGSNFAWSGMVLVLVVGGRQQGHSSGLIGVMLGLIAVGGLLGSAATPKLLAAFSPRIIVTSIFWASGVCFGLITVTGVPVLRGAIVAIAAAAGPAWNAVVVGTELRLTPDALRGRVNAASMLLGSGAAPLGALVAGAILAAGGHTAAIVAFAGVELGLALIASLVRSLRAVDETPAAQLDAV